MPRYDFKCDNCNIIVELFLNIKDNHDLKCKKCNYKLNKIYTPTSIIFNGSGFYKTENRKK